MSGYGEVAVRAVELIQSKDLSPKDAWNAAVLALYRHSESSQDKGCPKKAFLGLCAAGLIRNVPSGDYDGALDSSNAKYAIAGVEILRELKNVSLADETILWKKVLKRVGAKVGTSYNQQLQVVLKLAEAKLLVEPAK